MQKVKVKDVKVETGQTGDKSWEKVTITGEDGTQFTTFDTKAKGLKGALIELEPVVKGRYVNFSKWNVLEESPIALQSPGSDPTTTMLQIQANFKIAALQVAGRLAAAGKIDKEEIRTCADEIYTWITSRTKSQKAPSEEQTTEEAWKDMERGERDPDTIKNIGNLFTACTQDFNMTADEVVIALGYSKKEEITESPSACYRTILRGRPLNNPLKEKGKE